MNDSVLLMVDIGGTHLRLCATRANVAFSIKTFPTAHIRNTSALTALMEIITDYLDETIGHHPDGIILGIPGTLARDLSHAVVVPNVPELENAALQTFLASHFECLVYLERDANMILMGEWLQGVGMGAYSALGVFLGTGIGSAFLVEGRPARGFSGGAMELGHITLRETGQRCVCGKLDCLETHASGQVLTSLAQQSKIPITDLFTVGFQQADIQTALMKYLQDNAKAIAMAIQLLDPEVVIMGGGIPQMPGFPKDLFMQSIMTYLKHPSPAEYVALKWSSLHEMAFVYGGMAVWKLRQAEAGDRSF
jgi:allose kinase